MNIFNKQYHFPNFEFIRNILLFAIIFLLIIKINSLLSFEYPSAVALKNGNIFIIEKNGIFICNPSFTNILKVVINFTNDEKINNETDLSKVVIKECKKNIFALIKNKFLVFDTQGRFLYKNSNILYEGDDPESYSLSVYNDETNDIYYYIIGYFDSNIHFNLFYYQFNIASRINLLIKFFYSKEFDYNFTNNAITCEFFPSVNNKIAMCFFFIAYKEEYYLAQKYFNFFTNTLSSNDIIQASYLKIDNNTNMKFIKSEPNAIYSKALICLLRFDNYPFCYTFYINSINKGIFSYMEIFNFQCRNENYGMNIRYLKETYEVVFSCSNKNGEIYSLFYDKDMIHNQGYKVFNICESVYGYSVLYLPNIRDYYVISDVKCKGNLYPFISLFDNDFIKYKNISENIFDEGTIDIYEEENEEEIGEVKEQEIEEIKFINNSYNKDCSVEDFLKKQCIFNDTEIIITQNIILNISSHLKDNSLYNILNNVTNEYKKDIIIRGNNIIYEITSSYNQNNKEYENISTIDLGECENILKKQYEIEENETLIIFKIDYFIRGLKTPLIKYEIFHPRTKELLDMKYCKDYTIKMNIPVTIDEDEIFKYDPSSDFYNDKCFPYTSDHNTDMTLYDRKNEFNKNNLSLCTIGCEFDGYNKETKKAICECQVETNLTLSSFFQSIINNEEIIQKFIDIKQTSNLGVIECYKLLFKKEGLINNIGSYILIVIIFIFIISCFIFFFKDSEDIKNIITNIIEIKKGKEQINNNKNIKNENKKKKKYKKKKKRKRYKKKDKKDNIINANLDLKKNKRRKTRNKSIKFETSKDAIVLGLNKKNIIKNENRITTMGSNLNLNNINEQKFTDYELNSMIYKNALINDKRTYVQYYFSLLRTKHLLIFSFYPKNDYNSMIIKVILFFFSFALYYVINSLFFNDSTMHKIYENFGIFNIIYQINQICYSLFISFAITEVIKYLSLTQKNVIKIKKEENIENIDKIGEDELKCIYKKIILFYCISFIFLFFFWYYIGCFCAVYKNTQIILIKDTLISFGLSLIYPFFSNLLPGILRIPALKSKNREFIYNLSKILQIF